MANLTLRSIPEEVMDRLRTLAVAERRSLNGEILVILEAGLERETTGARRNETPVNAAIQSRLWDDLCGRWKDNRGWKEIADDIVSHRTAGRKVAL